MRGLPGKLFASVCSPAPRLRQPLTNMKVTVAICTWNRSALLRQTLEQFRELASPRDVDWELLVVDNNSTDDTCRVADAFVDELPIRYVFESTPGLSPARNRALKESVGTHVIFTDDDVLVDPNWLTALLDTWRRFPGAEMIGGPIEAWFPVEPDPMFIRAFPFLAAGFCGLSRDPVERVLDSHEQIHGANFGVRLSGLRGKQFDPAFGPTAGKVVNGDEFELTRRVRADGGAVVWSPHARVKHYVDPDRMTLPYLRKYYSDFGRSQARLHGLQGGARIAGIPMWLWRQTLTTLVKTQTLRLVGAREGSLHALRDHLLSRGMLVEGYSQWRNPTVPDSGLDPH